MIPAPLKSIRAYCVQCCNGQMYEVRECPATGCPLHPYRFGHRPPEKLKLTPVKSIRAKCLDCSAGSVKDVRECWDKGCALYPYRMGKNPNIKGNAERVKHFRFASNSSKKAR